MSDTHFFPLGSDKGQRVFEKINEDAKTTVLYIGAESEQFIADFGCKAKNKKAFQQFNVFCEFLFGDKLELRLEEPAKNLRLVVIIGSRENP